MERVIHQIWMGRPMPYRYKTFGRRWEEMNPGWGVKVWRAVELNDLTFQNAKVLKDLLKRDDGRGTVELYVQMADVMSYELIVMFGGIYLNADIEPIRTLEHMHAFYGIEGRSWAGKEDRDYVVNAAMGGPRDSWFYQSVVDVLEQRYFGMDTDEMNQTTGPRLLTDHIALHGRHIRILPPEAFNPVHWRDVPLGGHLDSASMPELPVGTIGLHHWGHRMDQRTNVIERGKAWSP